MKIVKISFILCVMQFLIEKTYEKIKPEVPQFLTSFSSSLKGWLQYDADILVSCTDSF